MTVSVIFLSINSNNELQRERKKKKERNAIVRYIFSVTFRGRRGKKVMKNSFKRHGGHVFTLYGISKLRLTGRGNAICS